MSGTEGIVELRVHGVGGAPPSRLLDTGRVERVAGDDLAGFYRSEAPTGRSPVEGYSWGGLTSASPARALWVLLSPFAVANLAGWLVPHGGSASSTDRRVPTLLDVTTAALIRIGALLVTVATIEYVAVATIDLIGYQCGGQPDCVAGRWWLAPWGNGWVASHPGRVAVVGAGTAMVVVMLLAWLTRRSQLLTHRAEAFSVPSDPTFSVNLNHASLWRSPQVAHRLGLTHTAAALSAIGVVLTNVAARSGVVSGSLLVGVEVVTLLGCVVAVARLDGVSSVWHWALAAWSGVLVVFAAILAWSGSGVDFESGSAPGSGLLGGMVLVATPVVVLAVGFVAWLQWRRHQTQRLRVAVMTPVVLLGALAMVNAFGAGLTILLAERLEGGIVDVSIVYPSGVTDVAVTTLMTMVVLVGVLGMSWWRAGSGPSCSDLDARYAGLGGVDCSDSDRAIWARRVARTEAVATLTDDAPVAVGAAVVVVLAGLVATVLVSGDTMGLGLGPWADRFAPVASAVLSLVPLLAVFVIYRMYRSRSVRRVVGIVWDVATLWPRWFHPWSPPAYGERAVPQLAERVETLAAAGGVVVSGHSQGSVLAVAALALVGDDTAPRVALLTHGSPLQRLYAGYFGEYFSTDLYADLARRVNGWVNLWRRTDFIGGPVVVGSVSDRVVLDPASPPEPGNPDPRPRGHLDYERSPEYARGIVELAGRLPG